jgi:hypothetical protein
MSLPAQKWGNGDRAGKFPQCSPQARYGRGHRRAAKSVRNPLGSGRVFAVPAMSGSTARPDSERPAHALQPATAILTPRTARAESGRYSVRSKLTRPPLLPGFSLGVPTTGALPIRTTAIRRPRGPSGKRQPSTVGGEQAEGVRSLPASVRGALSLRHEVRLEYQPGEIHVQKKSRTHN